MKGLQPQCEPHLKAAGRRKNSVLRQLYRSFVSENSPEAKGRTLLRQWLTAAQRRQFEEQGYFGVVGCATRRR